MSYIGNTLPANFQSLPAVQRFNGDGSDTTFTLAAQIANDQSILVSVDGVTQDSNAYSVSGTTITFTSAPSAGTGNIFVNTISPVGSTVVPPDGIAINATTGTFSGDLTVDTSTLKVDSSNNRVGIGTASPSQKVTVDGGLLEVRSGNALMLRPTANNWDFRIKATGNNLDFHSGGNLTTPKVSILNTGGITFNGDTAAANALDDYEEGTWSPQIYLQNSTDQSNASNQTQDGRYTKIGNIVTLQFSLIFTLGSSLNNDNIGVKNFPFTSSATIKAVGGVMQSTSLTSGAGYLLFVEPSGSKALLLTGAGGGNLADEVGSGSGKQLYGSIVYQTG